MRRVKIIDSHTGGEPTRIIVEGGPNLGHGSLQDRRDRLAAEFDSVRSAVILEPRGSDVLVGGLLCQPTQANCAAGVIFFNNTGYLHMCGHGTMGLLVTLAHLGRLSHGQHDIETPVGIVTANLLDDHRVALTNVPSYRYRKSVSVTVDGHGPVTGDIAWGGNWFFLVADHQQSLQCNRTSELTHFSLKIRAALERDGITGADGGLIDHIELFSAPDDSNVAHSQNFVLCPGGAYDRSPCGTGTSAKLACLAADGKLPAGEIWRQQSIIGSVFEGTYMMASPEDAATILTTDGPVIVPTITGSAWVTSEAELLFDASDPFVAGIIS